MFHFHCLSSLSFDIRIRAKFGVMKKDLYEILLKEKIPRFSFYFHFQQTSFLSQQQVSFMKIGKHSPVLSPS